MLKFDFDKLEQNRVEGDVSKLSEQVTYLNDPNIEMNEAVKSDLIYSTQTSILQNIDQYSCKMYKK
jgi:hypothetical protein